jgi:hypothetical protein
LDLGFLILGVDDDAVKVNHGADVDERAKNVIRHSLEGSRCVGETERHDTEVEVAITTGECGLLFSIIRETYLPIARAKVEYREDGGVLEIYVAFVYTR